MDPDVFDALKEIVRDDVRTVAAVEEREIVPASAFRSELIIDSATHRAEWFAELRRTWGPGDLVFFDPDNGLAVPSVPEGRRNSSKYLYWSELADALGDDRSTCVYQHFARRKRGAHLNELGARIRELRVGVEVAAVTTPRVAFVLAGRRERVDVLRRAAARVVARAQGAMALADLPACATGASASQEA